jgi:hypothetical protein
MLSVKLKMVCLISVFWISKYRHRVKHLRHPDMPISSHLRYREGSISYLDVIDSDRSILQQEQLAAQLHGSRMIASVDLIRALGGGWH